jgi:hypothetical protein
MRRECLTWLAGCFGVSLFQVEGRCSPHMNSPETDPRVCGGNPVIQGTRIPVAVIVSELSDGRSWADIRKG